MVVALLRELLSFEAGEVQQWGASQTSNMWWWEEVPRLPGSAETTPPEEQFPSEGSHEALFMEQHGGAIWSGIRDVELSIGFASFTAIQRQSQQTSY